MQERRCRGDTELAFKARHKQFELVTENWRISPHTEKEPKAEGSKGLSRNNECNAAARDF